MKPVQVSPRAYDDIRYLELWLAERAPQAAARVGPTLLAAFSSLEHLPERGRQAIGFRGRELFVPFGERGYLIRYRVEDDRVVIARVFHSLERR